MEIIWQRFRLHKKTENYEKFPHSISSPTFISVLHTKERWRAKKRWEWKRNDDRNLPWQERNYIKLCLLFYAAKVESFSCTITHERRESGAEFRSTKNRSLNWPILHQNGKLFKVFIVVHVESLLLMKQWTIVNEGEPPRTPHSKPRQSTF